MLKNLSDNKCDVKNLSVSSLAFVGDSVFDLFVKEYMVRKTNRQSKYLHENTTKIVCCQFQSKIIKILLPYLTEKELSVYKRGRNYHSAHIPKNYNRADYQEATALETLFGFIYLSENIDRLKELFDIIEKYFY